MANYITFYKQLEDSILLNRLLLNQKLHKALNISFPESSTLLIQKMEYILHSKYNPENGSEMLNAKEEFKDLIKK